MRALIVAFLCLSLIGASCQKKIIYVDRIVEVPTIVMEQCPELPQVEPVAHLPVDALHKDSTHSEVARAYVKTVVICENKLLQYKEALEVPNDE